MQAKPAFLSYLIIYVIQFCKAIWRLVLWELTIRYRQRWVPSYYKENVREKAYDQTILPGAMRLTGNRRTLTGLKAMVISIDILL